MAMGFRLKKESLEISIKHLVRYGDTDIFPHLTELSYFADCCDDIVAELTKLDLDSFAPSVAIEGLAPKSRYGFRIAHQLPALDNLLLLACVVELGEKIELKRQAIASIKSFSYRFVPDVDTGQIYSSNRTYKLWLERQQKAITKDKTVKKIILTDISDFYSRINFHRLENLLDEVAPNHGAARFIKKHIKIIRAKQSFGLPVGGSAARLLAELALTDTDSALLDQGLRASRFVDDFRIFLKQGEDPYDALGFLAEQLGINEGLSLNVAKTSVMSRKDYLNKLDEWTTDVTEEAEGVALEALTADIYFDDEPDEDDLEKLKGLNLVGFLKEEIQSDNWDMGRIKVIFRALRIVKPDDAVDFVKEHFEKFVVFAKEICLLMEALEEKSEDCFGDLKDRIIEAILNPPASSVQTIRSWLLEIFCRGIVKIKTLDLKSLDALNQISDRRQLLIIRGRCKDLNYFRKQKTAIGHFSDFELPCLVWGASCLPKDEYEKWIESLKVHFARPTGTGYLKWLGLNKDKLNVISKHSVVDQPD